MICWGSANFPTPSFGRDGRGTHWSFSTTTSDSESEVAAETSSPSCRSGRILPHPNLRIFTVAELRAATKNFRSDLLLCEGGFGRIYKGWIEERNGGGSAIAIKKWNPEGYIQGIEEWRAEVDILGRLSHPNLVKLLGYCCEGEELLLVYEYMHRGGLEHHLFGRGAAVQPLPWDTRLKILIGGARGLAFLHTPNAQVIYRDFKASNILLDPLYNAKITDFGMAKLGPTESESYITSIPLMGTYGYVAPEYVATGHLYVKSDVFSFGVFLLEMLTGLRAMDQQRPNGQENIVDWIIPYLLNKRKLMDIMDSKLEGKYPPNTAYQIAQLALKCIASEPENRPSMEEVLKVLEKVKVSNVERKEEPKAQSVRAGSQATRPVQLPIPPRSFIQPK